VEQAWDYHYDWSEHRYLQSAGFDGGKQIKGRKRHIVVGHLRLLLGVFVHSAIAV